MKNEKNILFIFAFLFLFAGSASVFAQDLKPGDAVIGKEKGKGASYLLVYLHPEKSGTVNFKLYSPGGELIYEWDRNYDTEGYLIIEENLESRVSGSGIYRLVINGAGFKNKVLSVPFTS